MELTTSPEKVGPTREIDYTGLSTLISLSEADALNGWMFEEALLPYVKGRTLEIGSGIGNISSEFIRRNMPLHVSDLSEEYIDRLHAKFGGEKNIKGIYNIDLADKNFETSHAYILGSFDTVFALNVVEHIREESLAIENCYKLLAPGGRLILLVPAWPSLYNRLDKELEHFRRYTSASLRKALSGRFTILKTKYFNLAGIFGWWLTGNVLRKKMMASEQVRFYNRLVPLFRLGDVLTFRKLGLSVIAVGEKK
jgi:SAM-dependent methyltransferase